MSLLSKIISPESQGRKDEIQFNNVVFPLPEGPITATNSPFDIEKFISFNISYIFTPTLYDLLTDLTSNIIIPSLLMQ